MAKVSYSTIEGKSPRFYWAVAILSLLVLGWLLATWLLFRDGLAASHLTQQVPWGLVIIVFIFFVGLSAGSFIISAISVLFGQTQFKVFSRMAGFTAILMIGAGLAMLISDWGRPDRILIPFLNVNPRSILSWNAFVYSAYMLNGVLYLWALFANKDKWVKILAISATALAVGVHSGTGSIFGVINGREMFFSSLTPVAFVISALSSGTGMAIILFTAAFKFTGRPFSEKLMAQLGKLLAGLIFVVIYLMLIEHFVHLYDPEFAEGEHFLLFGGNGYTLAFWGGLIFVGGILPLIILLGKKGAALNWIMLAGALHVIGVFCERIIIALPGQVLPQPIFPGAESVSSDFQDGVTASYFPNLLEIMQVVGIVAGVILVFMMALKILPLLPNEGNYIGKDGEPETEDEGEAKTVAAAAGAPAPAPAE